MRLSSTFAALVAIVPAFVNAIPPRIGTTIPTRVGTVIPLTKRAVHLADEQGVVDCEVLRSQVTKVSRYFSTNDERRIDETDLRY